MNNNSNSNNNNNTNKITIINTVRASAQNVDRGRSRVGLENKTRTCTCNYRKQIARQLHTQYVDGINSNLMTFKSRLRVIQVHWKQNHWIDHTRLTICRVI